MANLIDGKLISTQIKDELKEEVAELKKKRHRGLPCGDSVGNDPASSVYVRNKKKKRRVSMSESNRFRMNLQRRLRRMRY